MWVQGIEPLFAFMGCVWAIGLSWALGISFLVLSPYILLLNCYIVREIINPARSVALVQYSLLCTKL